MEKSTIAFIWADRKRHLGLPLSFTRYGLSEDRLFLTRGFLNIREDELLLYRVRDISLSRNLWQRLFRVGTVLVDSSDKTTPQMVLQNIKNPMEVKELLHRNVEEMKIRRRVRLDEIMNGAESHNCSCDDDDDLID